MDEDVFIHIVGHRPDLRVVVLPKGQNGDPCPLPIGGEELLLQPVGLLGREGHVERGQVEGDRHVRAVDVGQHPVLVVPPLGEPAEPVVHPLAGGVEDMGAVLVNEHAAFVQAVVGVAAHMVPALQHQHPLSAALRQLPGRHRARVARADHQTVKGPLHPLSSLSPPPPFGKKRRVFLSMVYILPQESIKGNEKSLKV